jgi:hypothetical protein
MRYWGINFSGSTFTEVLRFFWRTGESEINFFFFRRSSSLRRCVYCSLSNFSEIFQELQLTLIFDFCFQFVYHNN